MKNLFLVLFVALFLSACAETVKPEDTVTAPDSTANADAVDNSANNNANALAGGKHVSYEEGAIHDSNNVLFDKTVYFAYDSNQVSDDFATLVKHHGKYLSMNSNAKVRLEGHADERGSREYNIALGEKRALAVKEIMMYQGASANQFTIISYGEEKPAELGHDEQSWERNRRVKMVYQ